MRPCVLKVPAQLDIFTKLNEYAIKYGAGTIDKYTNLFREMQQNREVMNKIGGIKNLTSDQISQQKHILTSYINNLIVIKSKIIFGRESYNCKIDFKWSDVIKDKQWKSHNINFEYYNSLYNLAVIYYMNGLELGANSKDDKNIKKDAVNHFKKAVYLFKLMKEEAYSSISQD